MNVNTGFRCPYCHSTAGVYRSEQISTGGWVEYATMATGIRSMVLLALAFYMASMLPVLLARVRRAPAGRALKTAEPAILGKA